MYRVILINDGIQTTIHSEFGNKIKLQSGVIKQGINVADSFTFSILPSNKAFNSINPLTSLIKVLNTQTGKFEFEGRVLKPTESMSERGSFGKTFICEGELGFLNDSLQRTGEYKDVTPRQLLEIVITQHNSEVVNDIVNKQFRVGNVTVTKTIEETLSLDYDTTLDAIFNLVDKLGGILKIRNENGIRYLDYLVETQVIEPVEIRLAKNLKSVSKETDVAEIITRLIPLGAMNKGSTTKLDIKSVNNGIDFVEDEIAKAQFSVITKTVIFDDIKDPTKLMSKAQEYLSENNRVKIKYVVNALDLSLIGLDIKTFEVRKYYRLINPIMGINEPLKVVSKTIDIINPNSNSIEMGDVFKTISQYQNDSMRKITTLQSDLKKQSQTISNLKDRVTTIAETKSLTRKKVVNTYPLRFADYQTIVSTEQVDYIYPQGFTIDWTARELFVLYSPNTKSVRWVVVFNLDTKAYKHCFRFGGTGGEGIVIKREGNSRYLYVKTTNGKLGKFNITTPSNLSTINPIEEYEVNLYYNFSYRNGEWLIEQDGVDLGVYERRQLFHVYDENFNLKRTLAIDVKDTGLFNSDYTDYMPKRQGIAITDDGIVQSIGGASLKSNTSNIPYKYQGLKLLRNDGSLIEEIMLDDKKFMQILEEAGYNVERIENEGVHVAPDGKVYTLFVYQGRFVNTSTSEGLILFEENTKDVESIDFSTAKTTYPDFRYDNFIGRPYPRSGNGKMYNFLTGELLDTVDKICDLMLNINMGEFRFYSSAVYVKDINNETFPTGLLVEIKNANNQTFFMDLTGVNTIKRYIIYLDPNNTNVRIQREITPS